MMLIKQLQSLKCLTCNKTTLIIGAHKAGKTSIICDALSELGYQMYKNTHIFEYTQDIAYNTYDINKYSINEHDVLDVLQNLHREISDNQQIRTVILDDCIYDTTFIPTIMLNKFIDKSNFMISVCYPFDLHNIVKQHLNYIIILPMDLPSYLRAIHHTYIKFLQYIEFDNLMKYARKHDAAIVVDFNNASGHPIIYAYDSRSYRKQKQAVRVIWYFYKLYKERRRIKAANIIKYHVINWLYRPGTGKMYQKAKQRNISEFI